MTAVIVYRSSAAGEATDDSDIDLVLLSAEQVRGRDLRRRVDELYDPLFNLAYLTPELIQSSQQRDWSFLACVADTGRVIAGDPATLDWVRFPQPGAEVTVAQLSGFAELIEHAAARREQPAGQNPRRTLHEIYRTVRQASILANAARGERAWRRETAFATLAARRADLAAELALVRGLEGHWLQVHRGAAQPAGEITDAQVTAALDAGRRLIAALIEETLAGNAPGPRGTPPGPTAGADPVRRGPRAVVGLRHGCQQPPQRPDDAPPSIEYGRDRTFADGELTGERTTLKIGTADVALGGVTLLLLVFFVCSLAIPSLRDSIPGLVTALAGVFALAVGGVEAYRVVHGRDDAQ